MPQTALITDVAGFLASLTLAECTVRFAGADCCTTPVLDIGEAVASPHHRGRRLVRTRADGALQALFPAHIDGIPPASRPPLRTGRECSTVSHETAGTS
jgi:crotonobetainyl-CoA:carnitine CoA-transferase CaiB-like acyl-CoA transferase